MESLPVYVCIVFVATTLLTVFLLYRASGKKKPLLFIVMAWLAAQSAIALTGFYKIPYTVPPRLVLALLPPLIFISILFVSARGKRLVNGFDPAYLTLLHVIRIPVELVLFWLCSYKLVPELITFEGVNFDIVSGITAPLIYYFGYIKKSLSNAVLLLWNFICLCLLLNVVIHALLAAPTTFQQFAFDQPAVAISFFPFVWLPCFIVMAVLFAHLACIRQLVSGTQPAHVMVNS